MLHGVRPVELGQRHHHRPELVDREVCDGGLGALPGVHRHRVAGSRSEGLQALREAIGERVQIRERVAAHRTVLVLEDEGGMVAARAARVRDHGVERDVGALRNPDPPRVVRIVAVEVGAGCDRGKY